MSALQLTPAQSPELVKALARPEVATVLLGPGEYVLPPLLVERSLTVIGTSGPAVTVLRAEPGRGLFTLCAPGSRVVLRGLTLVGGTADGGGAVEAGNDAEVEIDHCRLFDNRAERLRGGAVQIHGTARVALQRCWLRGNRSERGGAVAVGDDAQACCDRCLFDANEAALGGALWASEAARLEVASSTFVGNRARHEQGGAALFVTGARSFGPSVTLVNTVTSEPGAIVNNPERPGTLALACCIVPPEDRVVGVRDEGGNLRVQAELTAIAPGLWALRPGTAGSGSANLEHIAADALDLLGEPLVVDGRADLGALAHPSVP
jgi:hypothetical protein